MADLFPPTKQRPALLAFRDALGCRDNALRLDGGAIADLYSNIAKLNSERSGGDVSRRHWLPGKSTADWRRSKAANSQRIRAT